MTLFEKIVTREIPAYIVYEDEICLAFLDISPATLGHTLVIPKKHSISILDTDKETLEHMISVTQDLAQNIMNKLEAKGVNIISNSGEIAWQSVDHFHIHIIPRFNTEEFGYKTSVNSIDLDSLYAKLK